MRLLLRFATILLCAGLLLGNTQCQQGSSGGLADSGPAFVTTMTVEDANGNPASRYSQGQTIQFVISVRNRLNTPQTIVLPEPPCAITPYSVAVVPAGTSNVVFWGNNPVLHCMLAVAGGFPLTFTPGQTMSFTVTWNQTGVDNQLVASGNYEVLGGIGCVSPSAGYSGPPVSYNAADCMPLGPPTADDLAPTQFRSDLVAFTIQ